MYGEAPSHVLRPCPRCGLRAGFMEAVNMDPEVMHYVDTMLCTNISTPVTGQLALDIMVDPPKPGDPSYDTYTQVIRRPLRCGSLSRVLLLLTISVVLSVEGDSPLSGHVLPECSAGSAVLGRSTRDELSAGDGGSLPLSQTAFTARDSGAGRGGECDQSR